MKRRIPSDYKNDVTRSTHNWRSRRFGTVHPGLIIPTYHRHLNLGDTIDSNLQTLVQSQPMLGPLLQGFDIVTIATFTPDSVLYGWMRNGHRTNPQDYVEREKWYFNPLIATGYRTFDQPQPAQERRLLSMNYALDDNTEFVPLDSYAWPGVGGIGRETDPEYLTAVQLGGLWDWLGVAPGATPAHMAAPNQLAPGYYASQNYNQAAFQWNIAPMISYILSCYYYMRNEQEDKWYYTLGFNNRESDGVQDIDVSFNSVYSAVDLNRLVELIDKFAYDSRAGAVNNPHAEFDADAPDTLTLSYGWLNNNRTYGNPLGEIAMAGLDKYGGLFPAPYSPDFFANIIKLGESPTAYCPIVEDDAGNAVAIPQLREANKWQLRLDRLFASGGMFGDIMRTLFGVKGNPYVNKPEFLGVWKSHIPPQNVIAQAPGVASDGNTVDLAQMAARVDKWSDYTQQQRLHYTANDCAGTIMCLSVIVPKVAYSQGLNPDLFGTAFIDDFDPEDNGSGFRTVPRHRYTMLPEISAGRDFWGAGSVNPHDEVVGEEVAYSWLRTDVDRLHGEFSSIGNLQYWALHRDYSHYTRTGATTVQPEGAAIVSAGSYSTYINFLDWQYVFTLQSYQDANFILMLDFDTTVTSSVSNNFMPFMGR